MDTEEAFDRALADIEIASAAYESEINRSHCDDDDPDADQQFPLSFTLNFSDSAYVTLELVDGYPTEKNVQVSTFRSSSLEKSVIEHAMEAIRTTAAMCLEDGVEGCLPCCAAACEAWEEKQQESLLLAAEAEESSKDHAQQQKNQQQDSFGWAVGNPLVDRKSKFLAYACKVSSETQVQDALRSLIESNTKLSRSSHNMYAYRLTEVLPDGTEVMKHDNDDDGESGAGSKLAHLLQVRNDQDVLVLVARWYGGIHLGPKRFAHIANTARDLLAHCEREGWPSAGR